MTCCALARCAPARSTLTGLVMGLALGCAAVGFAPPAQAMGTPPAPDATPNATEEAAPRRSDAGLDRAAELIRAEQFEQALPVLAEVLQRNPQNADALNWLGYANRRLGRFDEAVGYYRQALAADPRHLGAREYLGEAYLEQGNVSAAQEQMAAIEAACALGCPELTALRSAIEAFQARRTPR